MKQDERLKKGKKGFLKLKIGEKEGSATKEQKENQIMRKSLNLLRRCMLVRLTVLPEERVLLTEDGLEELDEHTSTLEVADQEVEAKGPPCWSCQESLLWSKLRLNTGRTRGG